MSQFPQTGVRRHELEYGVQDKTIFNFFNAVYAWMAVALAVTAAVAWYASHSQSMLSLMYGSGRAVILFMVLGAWGLAYAAEAAALRISAVLGTVLFMLYAVCIGAMISG